jgi:geranylgeranylglycerol-phosphate geranylgeranyltransferase
MAAAFVRRLAALAAVSRPMNGAIAVLGVGVGAHVAVRGRGGGWTTADGWGTVAVALATLLILSGGNAFNDACDAEIDRVNRPGRPVPSGRVSRRAAFSFAAATMGLGLAVAAVVDWWAVGLAWSAVVLLVVYSVALKRSPLAGNIVVGALSAGPLLGGGIAAGATRYAAAPMVLVFLFSVAREVVKDMEDAVGDARAGARTAPVVWGARRAAALAAAFGAAGVAFSVLPYGAGWPGFGLLYLLVVLAGVDTVCVVALLRLWRDPRPTVAGASQRWMKASMFAGLVAFSVG